MNDNPISPKTYAALAVLTAIKRPWGFRPIMIDVTADLLGIYNPMSPRRPHQRTRSRILKQLVRDGLLKREGKKGGTTYYPTEKLATFMKYTWGREKDDENDG